MFIFLILFEAGHLLFDYLYMEMKNQFFWEEINKKNKKNLFAVIFPPLVLS